MFGVGMVLLSLGVMSADSECLIFPTIMVFFGAFLMWKGSQDVE